MDKNIESFLEKLKTSHQTETQIFANSFDERKMNFVLKIMQDAKHITEDEWENIITNYETDPTVSRAIILSKETPEYAKDNVISTLVTSKLTGKSFGYERGFVREILENYPEMEPYRIEMLFNHFHNETMNLISHPAHNGFNHGIAQPIVDTLAKLELEVMNGNMAKPYGYREKQHCFTHLKSEEMYQYLLKNMPSDAGMSEKIATAIINNPYFDDEKKNKVFAEFGCNPDALVNSTTEISNTLYESAIYSAYDMSDPSMSGYTYHMIVQKARNLLDNMVRYDLLSEALEYDLVSRAIEDARKTKDKKMNDMLRVIMNRTTSEKVLHLIYTTAPHINDRDDACNNENISKDDLKAQAKLYLDKIAKKVKSGKVEDVADKWILEVYKVMKRIPLEDVQYGILIQVQPTQTLGQIISEDKTPDHIIDKSIDILKRMQKEDSAPVWTELLTKAEIAKETRRLGYGDKGYAEYVQYAFHGTAISYESNGNCERTHVSSRIIKEDNEFAKKIPNIIEKAICQSGWKPKNGTIDEYHKEVEKMIKKNIESNSSDRTKGKALNEMKYYEIISAQEAIVNELAKHIRANKPEQFTELKQLADEYMEFAKEYNTRDIQKEAMNTLDL